MHVGKVTSTLVLLGALVAAACSSTASSGTSSKAGPGGTVRVRLSADWNSLNPYSVANISTGVISTGIYDRLVSTDAGNHVVPYLATSWKVTPSVLQFHIRSGVTCSDGTPLGAQQVADSLQSLIGQPQGKAVFGPGRTTITADPGAGTVTIGLAQPFSDALLNLTGASAVIECPAELALAARGDTEHAVGSGPYTIVEAIHNDHLTLKARPGWKWGPNGEAATNPGFPDTIVLSLVANETTAANELLTGQLDLAQVNGPDVSRLISDKSLKHYAYGGYYLNELIFNRVSSPAVSDPMVRRAVMTAIDPRAFMLADTSGYGLTSSSFLAPSAPCYDSGTKRFIPKPSAAAARALLQQDGYTAGPDGRLQKDGKPLVLRVLSTSVNFGQAPEYLAQTLSDAGITATLSNPDFNTYVSQLHNPGLWDVATEYVTGGGPAVGANIIYMTGPRLDQKGTNVSTNDDQAVADQVAAAEQSTGATSCQHWAKAQELMLQDWDMLPLDQQTKQFFGRATTMAPAPTIVVLSLDTVRRAG